MIPVNAIVKVLVNTGAYKSQKSPVYIADADLSFDADAVLVGPDDRTGLILVIDGHRTEPDVALRKVRSLAMVLDRVGSRRTLSVVIVTDKLNHPSIKSMENFCRLIAVHPADKPEYAIRSLLPVALPRPEKIRISFDEVLEREMDDLVNDAFFGDLRAASERSVEAVEEVLIRGLDGVASDRKGS